MSWLRFGLVMFVVIVSIHRAPRADSWIVGLCFAALLVLMDVGDAIRAHTKASVAANSTSVSTGRREAS